MERIASRRHALVLQYRAAARGDAPVLLLDGAHLVQEALAAGVPITSALVLDRDLPEETRRLASQLRARDVPIAAVTDEVMAAASPLRSPGPIVALANRREWTLAAPFQVDLPLVLVACDIQDPGNLGAMIRVSEAAGATGVIAAGATADPFGWKALRGSMGSGLRLPVPRVPRPRGVQDAARARGCQLVAAVPRGGTTLFDADLRGPLAVFLGAEGRGLDPDIADAADVRVTIPMAEPVESLNAAVAAALVLYECHRQRRPQDR